MNSSTISIRIVNEFRALHPIFNNAISQLMKYQQLPIFEMKYVPIFHPFPHKLPSLSSSEVNRIFPPEVPFAINWPVFVIIRSASSAMKIISCSGIYCKRFIINNNIPIDIICTAPVLHYQPVFLSRDHAKVPLPINWALISKGKAMNIIIMISFFMGCRYFII